MILIVSLHKHPLHYYEFVKPIADLIKKSKVVHFKNIKKDHINNCKKIIICGTSLKDMDYLNHYKEFSWIKKINKPILGICAGMQVIGKIYKSKLIKNTEIGVTEVKTIKTHKFFESIKKVYSLHNLAITKPDEFDIYIKTKYPQAIKHKKKEIYGVLFHPEVLNKNLIEKFAK